MAPWTRVHVSHKIAYTLYGLKWMIAPAAFTHTHAHVSPTTHLPQSKAAKRAHTHVRTWTCTAFPVLCMWLAFGAANRIKSIIISWPRVVCIFLLHSKCTRNTHDTHATHIQSACFTSTVYIVYERIYIYIPILSALQCDALRTYADVRTRRSLASQTYPRPSGNH